MRHTFNISDLKINFSLNIVNNILFILILVVSVFYVTTINDLAVKGFAIQELEKEVKSLQEDEKDLELRVAYLRSYNYLDEKISDSGFIVANNVEYITLAGSEKEVVARK